MRYQEAKQQAEGRWAEILGDLAPDLAEAIERAPKHVGCPAHGGTDGFRWTNHLDQGGAICNTCGKFADGFDVLVWYNGPGYTRSDALRDVALWLESAGFESAEVKTRRRQKRENERRRRNVHVARELAGTWQASVSANEDPTGVIKRYLRHRGIVLPRLPSVLRFCPNLVYQDKGEPARGTYPAIAAVATDAQGNPVTLHRTYLTHRGTKAAVPKPKKLMAYPDDRTLSGGAIRLFRPNALLGLAEGIETALAAHFATAGMPVWSTISATLLQNVILPEHVTHVMIWADRDRSGAGQEAANELVQRLRGEGRRVTILLPKGPIPAGAKGLDWNDVLVTSGWKAFPFAGLWRRLQAA